MAPILPCRHRIRRVLPAAKLFVILGALAAALGVALGAFGAHALKARLSAEMLAVWQTAVQYLLWHALGLIAISLLAHQGGWDEILLVAAPMAFVGWLLGVAKKRMSRAAPSTADPGLGAEAVPGTGEPADHAD